MIVVKAILYIVLSLLLVIIFKKKEVIKQKLDQKPVRYFWLISSIFRLIPFIIIYIFAGFDARSDVVMFYDSAQQAMQGKMVYKEFESAYSPLFAYLSSLCLFIWQSPKAIVLEMIFIELGILWLSLKLSKASIYWGLFYLCLPASFILSVLGGQEDIWMWGMVALALMALSKTKNEIVFGILLGFGFLLTKALFILLFPSLFLFSKHRLKLLTGMLLVGIPSFLILFSSMEWEFLEPIQQANDPRLPNMWSILHPLTNGLVPLGPKWINWLGLVSLLSLGFWLNLKRHQENTYEFTNRLFIGIFSWLMISQQSSVVNYVYAILLPIVCFYQDRIDRKFLIYLLFLNFGVVLQAPLWWSMGMPYFHSVQDLANAKAFAEYALEFCVIIPLIWIIWLTVFKKNKVILSND